MQKRSSEPQSIRITPKKSTRDAAMAVKEFAEEGPRQGLITILVSLEVEELSTPPGGRVY